MAVKASNFITLTAVVDVSACFRYYLLQSSTLAKPAKPTAKPPGGSWTDAEPSYTAGSTNSLYFVDLTVFSDGTWAYSAVSLSSSYEAAKEAYNRAVAAQATAQQALSNTEVIVGTQTAATGAWTGVASFSSLQDGQQIVYWLPYAGSGSASLNLTLADGSTTGAKPCYYSGASRITTHYAAGNAIHLTYRVNANVNGTNYTGWWADANWNTDTTDRMRMYNSILAASAITGGYLIVGTSSGYSHLAGGMELAMDKARKCGIGYVGVRNSCHFGAAGYYANLAAQNGMIGLAMSNTDPNMAVPNSSGVAIGNNPFSFAVPYRENQTIFLDMALSNVAALKVIMAKESGKAVPSGWLVDKEGQPTNDPSGFPYESFLLPVGAHKGYGLAMLVEMLASVLTGAGIASEVSSWNLDMKTKNNTGNAFIAIDIAQIMPQEMFAARVNQLVEDIKSRPKAKCAEQIFLPGEIEWNKRQSALAAGTIALTDAMVDNLTALSDMTGIQIDW